MANNETHALRDVVSVGTPREWRYWLLACLLTWRPRSASFPLYRPIAQDA